MWATLQTLGDPAEKKRCVRGPDNPSSCYVTAQTADAAALDNMGGGITLPALVRALHGTRSARFVALLRNPADRLWACFRFYPHYSLRCVSWSCAHVGVSCAEISLPVSQRPHYRSLPLYINELTIGVERALMGRLWVGGWSRYGEGMDGFQAWFEDQSTAFRKCEAEFNTRDCALYFESLGVRPRPTQTTLSFNDVSLTLSFNDVSYTSYRLSTLSQPSFLPYPVSVSYYTNHTVDSLRSGESLDEHEQPHPPRGSCTYTHAGPEYEDVFYHADQLIKGMYSVFMSDWLEAFPREAMLVVRAEDYFADNKATLHTVYAPCTPPSAHVVHSLDPPTAACMWVAGVGAHRTGPPRDTRRVGGCAARACTKAQADRWRRCDPPPP